MSISRVPVRLGPDPYPVYIGAGILRSLPALLSRRVSSRRCVIVTDRNLRRGIAARAASALRGAGWKVDVAALPAGERAKSLASLSGLYRFLLRGRAERMTPIIAVGGGTVGDAAGFAAATYYRGVPLVHVPTTLLAQVDSAIGGKTAVNHPLAKNAVGAFYQPILVVADLDTLRSLPEREFRSGLAETVKYGLVFDRAFSRKLLTRWDRILERDPRELGGVVRRCVELKAGVVARDERDLSGRRELLNFGHTVGHALEAATGYRSFRHGEAVAWGMRAATLISEGRGWLRPREGRKTVWSLLDRLSGPDWPGRLSRARLLKPLALDKKVREKKNVFVLLKDLARPVRVGDVTRVEIESAVAKLSAPPGRRR
ncbi:3-dehydroquinate synthase [Elusimicrobiota bacterium]